MMVHLNELESIAEQFSNSRAVLYGYNESVEYVVNQLKEKTNYVVTVQYFPVQMWALEGTPSLVETSPGDVTYQYNKDFVLMSRSGPANNLSATTEEPAEVYGCSSAAYAGFTAGNIAVVSRGGTNQQQQSCTFADKQQFAQQAGAVALLIYNEGNTPERMDLFNGGASTDYQVPVFALPYELGRQFASVVTSLTLDAKSELTTAITSNVLADTEEGNADNVIVVGSHLDSVPAGPGINDNGSGSSANLEFAIRFSKKHQKNKVRFAWWGAEEIGLLGSNFYVTNLAETNTAELARIALNLNFDMIASPNYFRGVYNGSQSTASILEGSLKIQNLFEDWFTEKKLNYRLTDFTDRSDYAAFKAANIPAGGLFSGAEVTKSADERLEFGGLAGASYDPCYHKLCDDTNNIDSDCFEQMAKAAASVLQTLAKEEDLRGFLSSGSLPQARMLPSSRHLKSQLARASFLKSNAHHGINSF